MIIKNPKYFHITVLDVKKIYDKEGNAHVTEWTGYGKITAPFNVITLVKATRKSIFNISYYNKNYQINMLEFFKNYLAKEDTNITTKFDKFEKDIKKDIKDGEQLSLF
jgi:hypothetical protein